MKISSIETSYPISFRQDDANTLGQHLKNRHCVVLVGMKRVGISNFLRFFLYHKDIVKKYIKDEKKHLFIPVDLNDLVERELFPFWRLTFKRIVDASEQSSIDESVKDELERLFLDSIQSQDLFLTIDNLRQAVELLISHDVYPTLFFLRFDRLKDAVSPEFFSNLQGLRDATHQRLAYVFTSFRGLDTISPHVFTKASLSVFSHNMFIKPAKRVDTEVVFDTYKNRYALDLTAKVKKWLFEIVDGYIQYLQLSLIYVHEQKPEIKNKEQLFHLLVKEERISLQSEELFESLDEKEKEALLYITKEKKIERDKIGEARYLLDTGIISEAPDMQVFSPLFETYLKHKDRGLPNETNLTDFTRKEHLLFQFLTTHKNEICEREKIIEAVWPEVESLGVSDWAIDRLVARVRSKLKTQKSPFEIQTIKTRGYRLVSI